MFSSSAPFIPIFLSFPTPFLGLFSLFLLVLGAQEQMQRNSVVFPACGIENEKRQKLFLWSQTN